MTGGRHAQLAVTCVECPEVSSLVGELIEHLAQDHLVLKGTWLEREEAVLACKRERLRFLQKATLLSSIESILDVPSLSGCESSRDMHGSESALMTCPPNVYTALQKSVVAAHASQQLRMPELQDLNLEPSAPLDASALNILGLSPTDLTGNNANQVQIIPELEMCLARHVSWLNDALGKETGDVERPTQPLCFKASSRTSELRRGWGALAKQSVENTALFAECSKELLSVLGRLKVLLQKHKLGAQRNHLEAKAEGLKATCVTLLAKLENFKAQFMSKAYTAENVQALFTVAGHIDGRRQELQERISKVQKKLFEYQENESELLAMAEEHRVLEEKIADAEYALSQLESL